MIHPFAGYLVTPEAADRVATPRVEDLDPVTRAQIRADNPDSGLHLLAESNADVISVRNYVARVTWEGLFREAAGWYVYAISEGDHTQTGVVAEVEVAAYDTGRIHRHEHTMAEIGGRVADILEGTGVSTEPVSLLYPHRRVLDERLAAITADPPEIDISGSTGRRQRIWPAGDDATLTEELAKIQDLYIADGHHRSAGASTLANRLQPGPDDPAGRFLVVLFPENQMRILGYHRCLVLSHRTPEEVVSTIDAEYRLEPIEAGDEPARGVVHICAEGNWYRLALRPIIREEPTSRLDAAALQHQVLGPLCDVADPRTDTRLEYVPASVESETFAAMCAERRAVGFMIRPPSVNDVIAVSHAGGVMPPKSTWFSPKVGAGIFLRQTV